MCGDSIFACVGTAFSLGFRIEHVLPCEKRNDCSRVNAFVAQRKDVCQTIRMRRRYRVPNHPQALVGVSSFTTLADVAIFQRRHQLLSYLCEPGPSTFRALTAKSNATRISTEDCAHLMTVAVSDTAMVF
eukprot:6201500-Pleurochrysis_carterae.AAC.1